MIDKDKRDPFDYQTLDIDKQMELADPLLLQHIQTLTKSCNETRKRMATEDSSSTHTKKVRRFYCLCVLLFCTNNRCCMPMHLLLTDVIKQFGGSSELIKMLNRLGAVASEDTHGRLVTFVSAQREMKQKEELNSSAFKVASVDNIDVLSHFAKAYAGRPSNIWHGTSIQCVEPKPRSLILSSSHSHQGQESSHTQVGHESSHALHRHPSQEFSPTQPGRVLSRSPGVHKPRIFSHSGKESSLIHSSRS